MRAEQTSDWSQTLYRALASAQIDNTSQMFHRPARLRRSGGQRTRIPIKRTEESNPQLCARAYAAVRHPVQRDEYEASCEVC